MDDLISIFNKIMSRQGEKKQVPQFAAANLVVPRERENCGQLIGFQEVLLRAIKERSIVISLIGLPLERRYPRSLAR